MVSSSSGAACAAFAVLGAVLVLGAPAGAPLVAQAVPATDSVSAPVANVRYDVTFDRATAARRTIVVAMTFDVAGDGPVLLSLPAWTPGAYELDNFARYVIDFTPRRAGAGGAADTAALRWDKVDYDTWRVWPEGARTVTVRFETVADTLDNAAAWSRADFALFNGTTVFMYPEGRSLEFRGTVVVHTEPDWLVATGMTPDGAAPAPAAGTVSRGGARSVSGAAGGKAAPAERRYREGNYHDLVDMPFFVGRFDYDSAQVAGRWTRFATYPVGSVSGALRTQAWTWIKRVIPPQVAVFGEAPWRTYTVMQIADSAYGGASGLEHQNSHVDIIAWGALDNPFVPSLYAHEIFHAWNVKRLRPAEMVPYRYDRPEPTTLLWVSEGVTDYYADLAEVRGGVIDSSGFFRLTAGKVNEVSQGRPVSLEDASLSTWVQPVNGQYIYYPKGSLAGLLLDVLIRDASDNRRSLDNVMRELYETTYARGRGFTVAEWWAAVSRAAGGRSLDDFNRRYVDGREPLPFAEVLPLAGLRFAADSVRVPQVGVFTTVDSSGVIVTDLAPGGVAAQAGVQPGDYLIAIGDIPVRDARFGEQFRAKYANAQGAPLPIRVRRGGRELSLSGTVRIGLAAVNYAISADPAASPKAARIRNGILRGVMER
jgi:predicted metalloprotease with PDZ domain